MSAAAGRLCVRPGDPLGAQALALLAEAVEEARLRYPAAAGIAKVLFFIFLVIFVIGLLTGRRAV